MTKVIILGEATPAPEPNKKPIEFTHVLKNDLTLKNLKSITRKWANIELICKEYTYGLDLMFAYDENRNNGVLYLGHFNDGVVE